MAQPAGAALPGFAILSESHARGALPTRLPGAGGSPSHRMLRQSGALVIVPQLKSVAIHLETMPKYLYLYLSCPFCKRTLSRSSTRVLRGEHQKLR
mmetsp:Transcript_26268/g.76761  ORF Transcript_26268/g.76761 Transcript_26268/m.76761 type:complete len:96 (+) Transcript_26268:1068-1355(+)